MQIRGIMIGTPAFLSAGTPAPGEHSSSDESIRRALIGRLRSQGWWDPTRCDVTVRDGIVQIAGLLTSAREKIATRTAAESIPGVRGVRDGRSYWVPEGGHR